MLFLIFQIIEKYNNYINLAISVETAREKNVIMELANLDIIMI